MRAPFYTTIGGRALSADSYVLFGARGSGKSATRLAAYRDVWDRIAREEKAPIVVTLDNYDRVLAGGLDSVTAKQSIDEIAFLVTEAILLWLSHLPEGDRITYTSALASDEVHFARLLINTCYLNRSEAARQLSGSQALRVINSAWHGRIAHWASRNWTTVSGVIGSVISAIVKSKTEVDVGADKAIAPLLAKDAFGPELADGRALLERLVSFVRLFGFNGIVVLVDKADETPATSDSAPNAAQLLYPLLSSTQLMEVPQFGWIFFLWDRVRDEYTREARFKIRLDKMQHATIAWSEAELGELVAKRIAFYSKGRLRGFADLCAEGAAEPEKLFARIVRTCARSPRELIKALDTIVRQHDEMHAANEQAPLLTEESIERGLDAYCVDSVPATYAAALIAPLLRLRIARFANKDVQQIARIGGPAARARIQKWVDANLVGLAGQRAAEGGVSGKPANEYAIIDPRVTRVVERSLRLSTQIEMLLENEDESADDAIGAENESADD